MTYQIADVCHFEANQIWVQEIFLHRVTIHFLISTRYAQPRSSTVLLRNTKTHAGLLDAGSSGGGDDLKTFAWYVECNEPCKKRCNSFTLT